MPPIFAPKPTPPLVLSFAASDPTGGAGIQADLLTLASMGCHPLSVITALTVQDTAGVDEILVIDAEWVADQARMLLEDVPVAAFKLGMLGSAESIAVIAEILADYPDIPVILDPVLASGRGDELANDDMIAAMRDLLIPQTSILTPNSHEARRLPGSYHGSGCTLASAIAAALAYGQDVPQAVRDAQNFTYESLKAAFRPGMGQYIPERFFWAQDGQAEGNA